ncbi:MAG: hypothetical protein MZV70_41605 [Desulfobacterales bacterium]|nr:hypothetical protein [Desulfobacterales bacterium]
MTISQDLAAGQRQPRPAGAVHDHVPQHPEHNPAVGARRRHHAARVQVRARVRPTLDGVPLEPVQNGRVLTWQNLSSRLTPSTPSSCSLIVGAGVARRRVRQPRAGLHQQRHRQRALGRRPPPPCASSPTRPSTAPTSSARCSTTPIANGYQDKGEPGLAGVRVVSARGLIATTDKYGRYHITCAVVPNENRGSNFILKLDERSLPSGYRVDHARTRWSSVRPAAR